MPHTAMMSIAKHSDSKTVNAFTKTCSTTAHIRPMFIKRFDTNHIMPHELPEASAFLSNYGKNLEEIFAEGTPDNNPFIALALAGDPNALDALMKVSTLYIPIKTFYAIATANAITSFPNLKTLHLDWNMADLKVGMLDDLGHFAPNVTTLRLKCWNDIPYLHPLMMPVMSKYPHNLNLLTVEARIRIAEIHTHTSLATLTLTRSTLLGFVPPTLENIAFHKAAMSTPEALATASALKHMRLEDTAIASEIPENVWMHIGKTLETYVDMDSKSYKCLGTRYLNKVRHFEFIGPTPCAHVVNLPLDSHNLESVLLHNVFVPLYTDFYILRNMCPNARISGDSRFGMHLASNTM